MGGQTAAHNSNAMMVDPPDVPPTHRLFTCFRCEIQAHAAFLLHLVHSEGGHDWSQKVIKKEAIAPPPPIGSLV